MAATTQTTKICKTCKVEKSITEYSPMKTCIGGYKHICKSCNNLKYHKRSDKDEEKKGLVIRITTLEQIVLEQKQTMTQLLAYLNQVKFTMKEICMTCKHDLTGQLTHTTPQGPLCGNCWTFWKALHLPSTRHTCITCRHDVTDTEAIHSTPAGKLCHSCWNKLNSPPTTPPQTAHT